MTDVTFEGKVRDRSLDTSWEATALQTDGKIAALQRTILLLLGTQGDMTDEILVDAYADYRSSRPDLVDATPQSLRTRRHELHVAGHVRDTGRREPTRAGATAAAVWALVQHGDHNEPTA